MSGLPILLYLFVKVHVLHLGLELLHLAHCDGVLQRLLF